MFGILSKIIGIKKSFLGIDIGTTSIKAIELSKKGDSLELSNYSILESFGHFNRANDVIQENSIRISEKQTSSLLKMLIKKSNFSSNEVSASIPSFASYTTLVEMPEMNDDDTKKAMSFQIQQSIPLPISEVAVDWMRVGKKEDENGFVKQLILIIAIPNNTIMQYKNIFRNVGLRLKSIEIEHLAYTRAVIGQDKTPSIIVDIGARSTNVTVVESGFVKDNNQIDYAGDSLTRAIMQGLGINYARAEELKKRRGVLGGGDFELSTLQFPFLDVIIKEIIKSRDKIKLKMGINVQRILLIGGGSNLLGISDYIEKQTGIATVLGNGLLYVNIPDELKVIEKDLQVRLATAIGLGIKLFI